MNDRSLKNALKDTRLYVIYTSLIIECLHCTHLRAVREVIIPTSRDLS